MPILADVGIPMICVEWPMMICALAPVIVVEALLIRRWVPLSNREAFTGIAKANIISTIAGIPLAWLAMLAMEFCVLFLAYAADDHLPHEPDSPAFRLVGLVVTAAWVPPFDVYWVVPAAATVLLVPCFFISVWIERKICYGAWPEIDRAVVRRGIFRANLASYGMLFVFTSGWIIFGLVTKKG